tara:strand:+ start:531 stop:1292 length:762 start_codon:yes stop_codon:yes gene_type:complete
MKEIKKDSNQEIILGINPAKEIIRLRPHTVKQLIINIDKSSRRINELNLLAESMSIQISEVEKSFFSQNYPNENHQGVAVLCNKRSHESEDLLDNILNQENIFLLILDHMTDPHNVGACMRSAAAAEVDAIVVPKDRSCHLTPTVRKISSGASELIPFIVVTNLSRSIKKISSAGVKVYGAKSDGAIKHTDADMRGNVAIVIGSEDKGLKELTAKTCNALISIEMPGNIDSLNASVTAGIILFEYLRQNKHAF